MKTKLLFLILLPLFSQSIASADADFFEASGFRIGNPPIPGSAEDEQDIQAVRLYQSVRTDEQCALAKKESKMNLGSLYGPETGVLTKSEVSQAGKLARAAIFKSVIVTGVFKRHFKRLRPYRQDQEIEPCIPKPFQDLFSNQSYPSSYAVVATVLKEILIREFPEKKTAIEKQAVQIGVNRVLGGVHHPSDIQAGVQLGTQLAKQFLDDHPIQTDDL